MGMFRSVHATLTCERCGHAHLAEVQFKTDDDWCEVYAEGDVAADLPTGVEWEPVSDRYCPDCDADRRAAGERATAAVLAARMRGGALTLTAGDAERPLSPEELMTLGEDAAEQARRSGGFGSQTRLLDGLVFLHHGGASSPQRTPLWSSVFGDAVDEELRRRGWPAGSDWLREDLVVFVDTGGRVRVRVLDTDTHD